MYLSLSLTLLCACVYVSMCLCSNLYQRILVQSGAGHEPLGARLRHSVHAQPLELVVPFSPPAQSRAMAARTDHAMPLFRIASASAFCARPHFRVHVAAASMFVDRQTYPLSRIPAFIEINKANVSVESPGCKFGTPWRRRSESDGRQD